MRQTTSPDNLEVLLMRVFVTGASGWIGSAVASDLLSAGHQVTGLTTSAKGARRLQQRGVTARVGRLTDHALLREEASRSEGVIHLAFIHGLGGMSLGTRLKLFAGALNGGVVASFLRILQATETGAVAALGAGLLGSDRPLVVASGVLNLPHGKVSTEKDRHVPGSMNRAMSEQAAFRLIESGVRATAVRLAPTVHGEGDKGFIASIITAARKKGVSVYVGNGTNRWPAVHRQDAARLFRLALEKGQAGSAFHGVGEDGIPFKDIASLISQRLQLPLRGISPEQSGKHFGMIAPFVALDNPSSSAETRATLGWTPDQAGLLGDMTAHYF
jgi:nucleoside-diphosphate-sugar epimerase